MLALFKKNYYINIPFKYKIYSFLLKIFIGLLLFIVPLIFVANYDDDVIGGIYVFLAPILIIILVGNMNLYLTVFKKSLDDIQRQFIKKVYDEYDAVEDGKITITSNAKLRNNEIIYLKIPNVIYQPTPRVKTKRELLITNLRIILFSKTNNIIHYENIEGIWVSKNKMKFDLDNLKKTSFATFTNLSTQDAFRAKYMINIFRYGSKLKLDN